MKGNGRTAFAFVASLTVGAAAVVGLTVVMGRGLLCLVVIPVLLAAFHVRDAMAGPSKAALAGILAAPLLVYGAHSVRLVVANVAHPPEWDLEMWSVYGHAAVAGVDFYTADEIRAAAPAHDYSPAFVDDVFATAFPHPPPTMFLMLPFGWWSMRTAVAVWYAINGLALLAVVGLSRRLFVPGSGALGLLLVATLSVILRPTQSNVALGQWNFLALLLLLLFWRDQGSMRAGAWLGGAVFLRTVLVALLVHPLRRREWRTVGAAGAAIAGLCLLAVAIFGATTCAAYLGTVSDGFLPFVYTESINQSLLATILRVVGFDPTKGTPLANPIYLGMGGVMTAVTGWLLWRLPASTDWMPGLTVSLALLLYPVSLEHYGVLVLPPTLSVWQQSRRGDGVGWWGVVLVTLVFTFLGVDEGRWAFVGLALVWAAHVGLGVAQLTGGESRTPSGVHVP
jgi:hypothetical protein